MNELRREEQIKVLKKISEGGKKLAEASRREGGNGDKVS